MNQDSAVEFTTQSRVHMGLAVQDLQRSLRFYRTLFGQLPTKTRPGYAKFEVAEPPLNLSLNQVVGNTAPAHSVSHFGIQVKSSDKVQMMSKVLAEAGYKTRVEEEVSCCYAVQNKVWATDPDGNHWEVYVVLNNDAPQHASSSGQCCANLSATSQSVEEAFATEAVSAREASSCQCPCAS